MLAKSWGADDWKALTSGRPLDIESLERAESVIASYKPGPCAVLSRDACQCDVPAVALNAATPDYWRPQTVRATVTFGDCITAALAARRVPLHLLPASLDAFEGGSPDCKTARAAAKALLTGDVPGLLLSGRAGVGKTYLACALLRAWAEQHQAGALSLSPGTAQAPYLRDLTRADRRTVSPPLLFVNVAEALEARRRAIDVDDAGKAARLWEVACRERLVVLDDLGAESMHYPDGRDKEWPLEQLFVLVNTRWENELPTVVTSNHDMKGLVGRLNERIVDRLTDMLRTVSLTGKSRRGQRA